MMRGMPCTYGNGSLNIGHHNWLHITMCKQTYAHTQAPMHTHRHLCTHTGTYAHTQAPMHTHRHLCTHTGTYAHTGAPTCMQVHLCTHMHTCYNVPTKAILLIHFRVQLVLTTRPNSPSMSHKPMLPRDLEGNMESRLTGKIRYLPFITELIILIHIL